MLFPLQRHFVKLSQSAFMFSSRQLPYYEKFHSKLVGVTVIWTRGFGRQICMAPYLTLCTAFILSLYALMLRAKKFLH